MMRIKKKTKKHRIIKLLLLVVVLVLPIVIAQPDIVQEFEALNGEGWNITVAPWGYITFVAKEKPKTIGQPISEQEAISLAEGFLEINKQFFGMEAVTFEKIEMSGSGETPYLLWIIDFEGQFYKGLPVADTYTRVLMTVDGQIYGVGNKRYALEDINVEPSFPENQAILIAKGWINATKEPVDSILNLIVIENGTGLNYGLVWKIFFGDPDNMEVLIDAMNGSVLGTSPYFGIEGMKKNEKQHSMIILVSIFTAVLITVFVKIKTSKSRKEKKKGLLFSFIMVFLTITLLTLVFVQRSMVSRQKEMLTIEMRIEDMNNLYESIVRDVSKGFDIITKRGVSVLISHISQTGEGIDQADFSLKELILNGTFNKTQETLMENATVHKWIDKMKLIGELKGYDINITFDNMNIEPYDSWHLIIEADIGVKISDQNRIANLTKKFQLNKQVSIEGFEDPIYILNTLGRTSRAIVKTPYEGNFTTLITEGDGGNSWVSGRSIVVLPPSAQYVPNKSQTILVTNDSREVDVSLLNSFLGIVSESDIPSGVSVPYVCNISVSFDGIPNSTDILVDGDLGKVWYIQNLKTHVSNSYCRSSEEGASFFDRLEGKLEIQDKYSSKTNNIIGIECFVDKNSLLSFDLPVDETKTNVDYLYFSNQSVPGYRIKGFDSKFRIDDPHLDVYGVRDLFIPGP